MATENVASATVKQDAFESSGNVFYLHALHELNIPSPAGGITSDLAAVVCSLVEWLVVSPRGGGVRDVEYEPRLNQFTNPHSQPFPRLRGKGVAATVCYACAHSSWLHAGHPKGLSNIFICTQ